MKEMEMSRVRSATYAFLANAYRFPDTDVLRTISVSECVSTWKHWIQIYCSSLDPFISALDTYLNPTARKDSITQQKLEESFIKLFGHTVRGSCPPYEAEYGKTEIIQQANELADIKGFYGAFGLEIIENAHERLDHASAECEFMSALAEKQVYAIEHGDKEALQILVDGQQSFLRDHLGQWFSAFSRRLQDADQNGFYGKIGSLAGEFIKNECSRFGVPCGPEFLELKEPDLENDTTIQCGVVGGCPGAQQHN